VQAQLREKALSQLDLARLTGLSQSMISSVISGRRMASAEVASKLAASLGVTVEWLSKGGSRVGHSEPMRDSASSASWHERQTYGDGERDYGNSKIESFKSLKTFVRETAQNSNDAALSDSAVIEYKLGVLSGERLSRFLDSIDWKTLRPHYEAVALDEAHIRTTRRYRDGLSLLTSTSKLWVLRIDDYGTSGLVGSEFDSGPFASLVRYSQDSAKRDAASGGRFGLGSSVLSAVSAFDLIFFSSDLATPTDGKANGRLIGRTFLPYHLCADLEFQGNFFFGKSDGGRRRLSLWATKNQLADLWLNRSIERHAVQTGTSILIVGFFDPGAPIDVEQAPEAVVRGLSEAFVDAFWPAVAQGRLKAVFSRYDNDTKVSEHLVDQETLLHPCASLLSSDSSLHSREVLLNVPKSRTDELGPFSHSARLIVKLVETEDVGAHLNEVAMWRKPEMVVKYRTIPLALGANSFRAALVCGEALASVGISLTAADIAADRFLARAEPPQHDAWSGENTDLVEEYYGGKAALRAFDDTIRNVLQELTRLSTNKNEEGPDPLRELLAFPSTGNIAQQRALVSHLRWTDDRYEILEATIRIVRRFESSEFSLTPILSVATESGAGVPIAATLASVTGGVCGSDGSIVPNPSTRDVKISLRPDWTSTPVRPELTALTLDVSIHTSELK